MSTEMTKASASAPTTASAPPTAQFTCFPCTRSFFTCAPPSDMTMTVNVLSGRRRSFTTAPHEELQLQHNVADWPNYQCLRTRVNVFRPPTPGGEVGIVRARPGAAACVFSRVAPWGGGG